MYTHILVALNGSASAEHTLPYVVPLATQFGARLTLLHVVEPSVALAGQPLMTAQPWTGPLVPLMIPTPSLEAQQQNARRYLEEVADGLKEQGLSVTYAQDIGVAAEGIVAAARSHGADLIALTSHGRSAVGRLFSGSVVDDVLHHTPCPLLVIRVSDEGEADEANEAGEAQDTAPQEGQA